MADNRHLYPPDPKRVQVGTELPNEIKRVPVYLRVPAHNRYIGCNHTPYSYIFLGTRRYKGTNRSFLRVSRVPSCTHFRLGGYSHA